MKGVKKCRRCEWFGHKYVTVSYSKYLMYKRCKRCSKYQTLWKCQVEMI